MLRIYLNLQINIFKYTNKKKNIKEILKVYIIRSITKSYILNFKIRSLVTRNSNIKVTYFSHGTFQRYLLNCAPPYIHH